MGSTSSNLAMIRTEPVLMLAAAFVLVLAAVLGLL
jgi:hypothetical protein